MDDFYLLPANQTVKKLYNKSCISLARGQQFGHLILLKTFISRYFCAFGKQLDLDAPALKRKNYFCSI